VLAGGPIGICDRNRLLRLRVTGDGERAARRPRQSVHLRRSIKSLKPFCPGLCGFPPPSLLRETAPLGDEQLSRNGVFAIAERTVPGSAHFYDTYANAPGTYYLHGVPKQESIQCDEYPFASTKEGAGKQDGNYTIQAVSRDDNLLHGQDLNRFYSDYRIVPGEEFWVKIVR
jgi:hypothetical protein